MATIQKVKRRSDYAYRVLIRQAGMKSVTKTFNTKRLANKFVNSIEGDRNKLLAYTQSKSHTLLSLVIDKYISNEYKGTRVNDERRKLSFWLKELASTFKIAHKHLVGDTKVIKNAVGIEREIETKAKAMAHILQGYERLILDVLITNSEPNDVAFLVHDCIVYYTPKSTAELSRIVKENTGFDLEFSEIQY